MADLRALWWAHVEQEARAGNLGPLAAELRKPDCGPIPVGVRLLLADLARGIRPRREKSKKIADTAQAEMLYLGCRATGMAAGDAVGAIEDFYGVAHSTAYAAVARVLAAGDRVAEIPRSQGAIPDDT